MKFARAALSTLIYFLLFAFVSILSSAAFFLGSNSHLALHGLMRASTRFALRIFGVRVTIEGFPHKDAYRGRIIVANHTSWFDQLALVAAIDVPLSFFAKAEYFRYPFLRSLLRMQESIPIDRFGTPNREVIYSNALYLLNRGKTIVIYPEGTRSPDGKLLPFKVGAFAIAGHAGAPLLSVYIYGACNVLPKGFSLLKTRPGHIRIVCGEETHMPTTLPTNAWIKNFQENYENALRLGMQS